MQQGGATVSERAGPREGDLDTPESGHAFTATPLVDHLGSFEWA